jgi:hypothetical protein
MRGEVSCWPATVPAVGQLVGEGLELLAGLVVAVAAARCGGRGNEPGQQTWGAAGVGAPQVAMAVAAQD